MSDLSSVGFAARRSAPVQTGVNVDTMVRTQRRMNLLNTWANEFVTSSPAGAISLAEGVASDDEMLRSATETLGFSNVTRLRSDLLAESEEVQRTVYATLPDQVQRSLGSLGYQVPEEHKHGRLFGSIPIVGDVTERVLDWGTVPGVGGALEEAQHFVGEGLEPVGSATDYGLKALAWPSEQVQHLYRASVYAREEGQVDPGGWRMLTGGWSASEIGRAWSETDEDKGYIRPGHEERARSLLGGDSQAYDLAHAVAMHQSLEDIIHEAGFEAGSAEATELVGRLQELQGTQAFSEAVNQISTGQVSFGRVITQDLFGLDNTNSGWGRRVSGLLDAGFVVFTDPLLITGKATEAARFGRNAFRLEAGALAAGERQADLALGALRAREGSDVGTMVRGVGRVSHGDMRTGRNILAWSDRVAEGFRTNDYAQMMRDLPSTSTALAHMSEFHTRQLAQGLRGLDTPLGVIEYLQDREGLLALMGTRLGGASPKVWGLRMPTLTPGDRLRMAAKDTWQRTIDWSRFAGSTPEAIYGPRMREVIAAAGNPRAFGRQAGRWVASRTVGATGRAFALLTSHTPYRDFLPLTSPDAVPEFTRLVNTGLFGGMSRQSMDDYINAFAAGDRVTRAEIEGNFLEELFRAGGIHDTPFAERFLDRHRSAYAINPEDGAMRLVDVGSADALAIPDVRGFLYGAVRPNMTRAIFHNPVSGMADAALSKYWKPAVLLRVGFIARAAGEELLHTILKNGARHYLGSVGANWVAKSEAAQEIRASLAVAESAGRADEIVRLRHALAETEGSMVVAPIRAMMAGSDRMFTQLMASTRSDAAEWRKALAAKAERFDPMGPHRTVSGLERFADEMSIWASGVIGAIAKAAPGDITKARIGELMAERWNPAAAAAAHDLLHHPTTQRYFAEQVSGATMTPWEHRSIIDANGVPVEKVTWAEQRNGTPVLEEINLRAVPGEYKLDRILDDPTFYRSLYTRHQYTREDRVERAIVDNVLPRFIGPWADDMVSRMGYGDPALLRRDLNDAWSHQLSTTEAARRESLEEGAKRIAGFDSGQDALGFMRRYIDGEIGDDVPSGWIASRLKDLFDDAGLSLSGGRFLNLMADPQVPMAAKRWMLYDYVNPERLIDDSERLQRTMRNAARGRLARPDMQEALRQNRLYARGERLARPVQEGISKVYVPLMPADYAAVPLGEDFVELARQRILRIGGYSEAEADTIARNAAASSIGDAAGEAASRVGMLPLGGWGASDPRVTEAVMAATEEVTGVAPTFGILEVPDEIITRSTDRVLAQGLRRAEGATDYSIDGWRLATTTPTSEQRRYVRLNVGDEVWDDATLDAARIAHEATPAEGTTRVYSADRVNWSTEMPTEGPFWFSDIPGGGGESPRQMLESFRTSDLRRQAQVLGIPRYSRLRKDELVDRLLERPEMRTTLSKAGATGEGRALPEITDDLIEEAGAHRLPGAPGTWAPDGAPEVSDGLGEIAALEAAADRTVDEVMEILTTLPNRNVADDVLHEVVEPLKRGDRYITDEATGIQEFRPGLNFPHLTQPGLADRLPTASYGPRMVAGRNLAWNRFVREWFDGPVNRAISSIVRKPMFLSTYGEQLRNVGPMAELMVDPAARTAALSWANDAGVPADALDDLVRNIVDFDDPKVHFLPDREINDIVGDYAGFTPTEAQEFAQYDLEDLKRFATQRHHAMNLARENALNRTMDLTIPFIDDHRIRSAFQNYVGNFIPFLFAEEQFLKRWARSVVESPEMIRRAQLGMNGLRSMGTVRRDDQGREIFVYPIVGDVAEVISRHMPSIFGKRFELPYDIQMTGDVGYTLPGFGDQMGVPSFGPLVGIGLEWLSRHFPELAEVEDVVIGRGANRPLWQYIVPAGAANLYNAAYGDIDQGQLASATIQAIQTMAINGQLPPETATPEEREAFIDRARSQARFILGARAMFGLTAPAAPAVRFEHDDLTEEFRSLLQADIPFEDAVRLYLSNHPEAQPGDLLAATVSSTETEFSGLDMPTDKAFDWTTEHRDLVEAYPAAAAWLVPRSGSNDTFSNRAYNQQLAMGLRKRKAPMDFVNDLYFRTAAQDYFDARQMVEEQTNGLSGGARQSAMADWRIWKDAYFSQHPLFAVMLQDPERQQKRHQAIDQLIALSARGDVVPPELAEMMQRFDEFRITISALRGDRRRAVSNRRASLVGETVAWMQWQVNKHPSLAGPYLRLIEPELRDADEDAVVSAIDDA